MTHARAALFVCVLGASATGCTAMLGLDDVTYVADDAAILAGAGTQSWGRVVGADQAEAALSVAANGEVLARGTTDGAPSLLRLSVRGELVDDAALRSLTSASAVDAIDADALVAGASAAAGAPLVLRVDAAGRVAWSASPRGPGAVAALASSTEGAAWTVGTSARGAFAVKLEGATGSEVRAIDLVGVATASSVARAPDDGAFVGGSFEGDAAAIAGCAGSSTRAGFVASLRGDASARWCTTLAGTASAEVTVVATAPSTAHAVVVAGTFAGTLTLGGVELTAERDGDAFVAALDDRGAVTWARALGGPGSHARPRALGVDSANVVVGGSFSGAAAFGASHLVAAGVDDGFVAALDPAGDPAWAFAAGAGVDALAVSTSAVFASGTAPRGAQVGDLTFDAPAAWAAAYPR
ncbi:MAG TPA: hypothetical protein VGM56_03295 [Byssovorax sp.]|jgi:hypothetical protein